MKKGRIQKRETDIQREIKRIEKMEQEKVKTIIFYFIFSIKILKTGQTCFKKLSNTSKTAPAGGDST